LSDHTHPDQQAAVAEEIAAEQSYVDRVYARLAVIRADVVAAEKSGYALSRVGNFGSLVERDAMVYHAARRRRMLDAEHEGLVFGRLDLRPGEVRYVGRLGIRDRDARSLVVDWRAPAAEPFYRATPADRMDVIRRRMIQSSGERVIGVEDDLLDPAALPDGMRVIGDGALVATLAKATGPGMRDIVATIQREQDEAIRSPASGVTLVRGGPGTGKTAVALHRVAYLMYSDRNRFSADGVLVVGPSGVFVDYIGRVLPSLGEDEVVLRSLGGIVDEVLATEHDRPEIATIKGSGRMARVLARAVRADAPGAPRELRLLYRGQLLKLSGPELTELRRKVLANHGKRNAVRPKAAGHVLDTLWRQATGLLPATPKLPREQFAEEVAERHEFIAFMRTWWPRLTPSAVLGWLADPVRLARWADGVLSRKEIAVLGEAMAGAGPEPTVQDIPLLDELDDLLGKPPARRARRSDPFTVGGVREVTTYSDRLAAARDFAAQRPTDYRDYAHVVVDEAQDLSPMQWRMIGRRGQHASWTIVGDPAQSSWGGDAAEALRARDSALGSRRRHEFVLTTNYRNSAEIFAVAAAVVRQAIPDVELPTAVRTSGVEPVHHRVDTVELPGAVKEAAQVSLAAVAGTVGIIAPVGRRLEVLTWVADLAPSRLQVIDALQAKGMEYDAVVLVAPDEILADEHSGVRTLYVALSRATLRLTTVGTDLDWLPRTGISPATP
jgi:hypothetical protein